MSKMSARVVEENGSVVGGLVELSNGELTVTGRVADESENQFVVEWEDGQSSIENKSDYELIASTKTAGGKCQTPGCSNIANQYGVCDTHNVQMQGNNDLLMRNLPGRTEMPENLMLKAVPASVVTADETVASENPAQPAGWAVAPVDANAYPDGELQAIEEEKREETAEWEDAQNRAPMDNENPAQPAGYAVPEASGQPIPGQGADGLMAAAGLIANVYADDITGENGTVELQNSDLRMTGKVIAANDSEFVVQWEDSTNTVENKSDYNLILNDVEQESDEV